MRKSTTAREIRVDTEARYKKMFLLLSLPDTKTRYRTHIYNDDLFNWHPYFLLTDGDGDQ